MPTASELPMDTSASAMDMANTMFGNGIEVVSATCTNAASASGIHSDRHIADDARLHQMAAAKSCRATVFQAERTAGDGSTNTTPGFAAGTLIDTTRGKKTVETLEPGVMVFTKDHGPQPVRWVGHTERIAEGADAPILFTRNALGSHGAVALSPNHRILLERPLSELLFGEAEVLIKPSYLENGRTIRRCADGKPVLYVHVLFDRHEIIHAEGLESESYHPGDLSVHAFDPETRAEVLRLMPDLSRRDFGYGPSARPVLRGYEARALLRA